MNKPAGGFLQLKKHLVEALEACLIFFPRDWLSMHCGTVRRRYEIKQQKERSNSKERKSLSSTSKLATRQCSKAGRCVLSVTRASKQALQAKQGWRQAQSLCPISVNPAQCIHRDSVLQTWARRVIALARSCV